MRVLRPLSFPDDFPELQPAVGGARAALTVARGPWPMRWRGVLFCTALFARLAVHPAATLERRAAAVRGLWLLPVRDLLLVLDLVSELLQLARELARQRVRRGANGVMRRLPKALRTAAYIGGLLGLAVLITLVLHADVPAMLLTLESWPAARCCGSCRIARCTSCCMRLAGAAAAAL